MGNALGAAAPPGQLAGAHRRPISARQGKPEIGGARPSALGGHILECLPVWDAFG